MGFLTGKTAIITGGGRAVLSNGERGSIGYGIATAYAKEGANLVLTGRNVQKMGAFYTVAKLPVDDSDRFCAWCLSEFQYEGQTVFMAPALSLIHISLLPYRNGKAYR